MKELGSLQSVMTNDIRPICLLLKWDPTDPAKIVEFIIIYTHNIKGPGFNKKNDSSIKRFRRIPNTMKRDTGLQH